MQPIPPLPTDNLYKFIFISGILLIILSFYTIDKQIEEINLNGDLSHLNTKKTIESLKNLSTEKKLSLLNAKSKKDSIAILESFGKDLDVASYNYKIDSVYAASKFERAKEGGPYFKYFFLGIFLTVLGGFAWYTRTQRYQDKLLQLQVENFEHESKKVSKKRPTYICPNSRTYKIR